jgi:PhnB protein
MAMMTTTTRALPLLLCFTIACGGGAASTGGSTTSADTVAPIPPGYHAITPAIVVSDIDAALAFYTAALGAETTSRLAMPNGAVIHGEMRIGDSIVMLSPENEGMGDRAPIHAGGSSGSLFLYVDDVDASIARAVEAGAELVMPAADMFWGDRYGQVRDRDGHRWALATHITDLTPEEMAARTQAFMTAMASGSPPPALEGGTPATSRRPEGYLTVTPVLVVTGPEAIDFYVRALGATEVARDLSPDGSLMHGEIRVGDSLVMLGSESPMEADSRTPAHLGAMTMSLMHYVPDADASFARAVEAGATGVMSPTDMFWGDRFGTVTDPSGQAWAFATHVRDVSEEEMVAAMAE